MTERTEDTSPRLKARIAGGLYLIVIIAGSLALYARSGLIVRGDAVATAANLTASEALFRLSIAAELIATVCYIGVVAILYDLLRPVSRMVSLVAGFVGLAGCVLGAVLALTLLAPPILLAGSPYLGALSLDQLQSLAFTWLRFNGQGSGVSFFFFGCYCLLLGYLVFRAAFLPRVLGALLGVAGLAWLTGSLASILSPPLAASLAPYTLAAGGLGEGLFTLWLLVMGVNATRWHEQAARRSTSAQFA